MIAYYKKILFLFMTSSSFITVSCGDMLHSSSDAAYFGGEIINPNSKFVYLCKGEKIIDTIELDNNNRFLQKYDTLTPGMYTFRHEPEYQYVYFDKGDSLMIRLNTYEFDNSLTFCGRGDEKNNFLIELFLKNEAEKNENFDIYDYDLKKFETKIDSEFKNKKSFYDKKRNQIDWDDDFDVYAKSMLDFPYFAKKELYPMVHQFRTNKDVCKILPKDYYDFRKQIDFNNEKLTHFAPFVGYLTSMLNNITCKSKEDALIVKNNIDKLKVTDSIFSNRDIKNTVLHNVAFMYLLEDQNTENNKAFLTEYYKLSTDKESKEKIRSIANSIQKLAKSSTLPDVDLEKIDGTKIKKIPTNKQKTVVFFWSSEAKSHLELAHKRVKDLKKRHPDLNFVAVNIDSCPNDWKTTMSHYNFNIPELHATNFEQIKKEWVITKIHRCMLLNADGTVRNAFINLFNGNFEDYLD